MRTMYGIGEWSIIGPECGSGGHIASRVPCGAASCSVDVFRGKPDPARHLAGTALSEALSSGGRSREGVEESSEIA